MGVEFRGLEFSYAKARGQKVVLAFRVKSLGRGVEGFGLVWMCRSVGVRT